MSVVLRPISHAAAQDLRARRMPSDVRLAADYPTEFSFGVGQNAGGGGSLGPFFLHRVEDELVVGEIGGGQVEPGIVEIGYAVVASCWGRGFATAALRAFVELARDRTEVARLRGHTPLDRPASGRVLEKVGFSPVGELDDEHEGVRLRVTRWELALRG